MRQRVMTLLVVAGLSAVLGVGYAVSSRKDEPKVPRPDLGTPVLVAGKDGEALRCKGKLVKLDRKTVGGSVPGLTPQQAMERGNQPSLEEFACATDAHGRETGAVTAKSVKDGVTTIRTLPVVEE